MVVFQKSRTNYLTCQTWNLPPNIWNHLALKLLCCIRTTWIIACAYDEKPPLKSPDTFFRKHFPIIRKLRTPPHWKQKNSNTNTQLNNKISLPFLSHLFPGVKTQVQQLQTPQLFYPNIMSRRLFWHHSFKLSAIRNTTWCWRDCGLISRLLDLRPNKTMVEWMGGWSEKKHSVWSTWNKDDLLDGQMICRCIYIYM